MKKALIVLILLVAAAMPFIGYAQEAAEPTCTKGFCTLTQIDSIKFASNATELPVFLNSLYKICIGLAAALAVLQIIRAGVTWSTAGDSHEKISEAKGLITMSIAGLVLVLSPVIVFSIINPEILSLKIGDIDKLTLPDKPYVAPNNGDGTCSASCPTGQVCKETKCVAAPTNNCPVIADRQEVKTEAESACCAQQTGCHVTVGSLNSGDLNSSKNVCACSAQPANSCEVYSETKPVTGGGAACLTSYGNNWNSAPTYCCSALQSGQTCCGLPK